VINPPAKKKRSYWSNEQFTEDAEKWLAGATEHAGSWWPEWAAFVALHAASRSRHRRNPAMRHSSR